MLSDYGGRGLRPDPPSPTGVNLLPASQALCLTLSVKNLNKWHVYYHGCQGRQLQQKTLFSGGERLMENNYY